MRLVDSLLDRTIDVFSEEAKTLIRIFSRSSPEFFTKLGNYLHILFMNIKYWKEEDTALLKNFQKHLNKNLEFKEYN